MKGVSGEDVSDMPRALPVTIAVLRAMVVRLMDYMS